MESAATVDAVGEVVQKLQQWFDVSITTKDCKADLRHRPIIREFMDKHTYRGKYMFMVKKCGSCEHCSEPRMKQETFAELKFIPLPEVQGEHYRPFEVNYYNTLLI